MVETLLPLAIGLPLIGAVSLGLGGLFIPALREARQIFRGLSHGPCGGELRNILLDFSHL
jgi:hypothetical protein